MCSASKICTYFITLLTFDRRRPWHCSLLPCSEGRCAVGKVEECQEMHTCINVHVYGCGQQGSVWLRVNRESTKSGCLWLTRTLGHNKTRHSKTSLLSPDVPSACKSVWDLSTCPHALPSLLEFFLAPQGSHPPTLSEPGVLTLWLPHRKPSRPWMHIQSWPIITVISWGLFFLLKPLMNPNNKAFPDYLSLLHYFIWLAFIVYYSIYLPSTWYNFPEDLEPQETGTTPTNPLFTVHGSVRSLDGLFTEVILGNSPT